MTEVATLGLKVDGTANIDNARDSLGRFVKSSQDAEKSTDSLSKGSQKSSKSLADVARESDRASSGMANLASAARTAGALIAASLGGISFGRVIKETAGFEQSLLGLQVVSGATAKQMKELERQSRTLGATSMFSAQQAADAQNYLAMAGFNVNEVLSATPGLLELAAAGSMDLASAADLASNVLGGFRLEVDQLGRVNDVLAAAAAGSNTSIQQLGQAMSYAAPIAAAAGVSIEQTAAAIGVLSDAGLQGSRAGTGLLGVIRQLSNVTPAAEAALNAYGLTVADVNVEQRGLNEVLEALSAANINAADSFKIFGSEAGPAAQILASGAVRVNEFTGELELAEGAARRAAQILGSGLEGSFKSLTSAIGESTLQLGRDSGLSAGLQEVIDYATGVISVYNGMLDIFQDANDLSDDQTRSLNNTATAFSLAAGAVGGLSAAYTILTGAVWAANTAMTAFTRLLRINPLVLAASALVALGSALYTARNRTLELGETTGTVGDYVLGAWQEVTTRVEDYWGETVDNVIGWLDEIGVDAGSVAGVVQSAFTIALDALILGFRLAFNTVVGTLFAIQTTAVGVANAISTAFTTLGANAKTIFSAIGDDITALLSLDFSQNNIANAIENELISVGGAVVNSVRETLGQVGDELTRDYFGDIAGQFSDLGSAIEDRVATNQQIAQLTEFSRGLLRLRGSAAETGETVVVLGDEVDDTGDSLEQLSTASKKASDAEKEHKKALQDSLSTYSALFKQISPAGAALEEYNATVSSLRVAYEDGTKSALEYYAAIGQAAKNYNAAVRAADPNIKRVEELTKQYDAAYLKGQELSKAVDDLNAAYRRGDIGSQQYGRSIANVRNEINELALAADPAAQELAKSWEEAAKRIDETFADAFMGAFDSFDSFSKQLMSGFKRLLSELAYQATLKPIVVQLTGQVQGALGLGGQGNQGISLDSLNPAAIRNGLNTIGGWFGGGSSSAAAGGVYSNVAGTGYTGALGNATSSGATLGGGAASGLYTAGAGFAGGYAGTALGESAFGKTANSSYGATAGAVAGAYIGSIVPVIGNILGAAIGGAIGGLGDALFGSGKKTFDFDFVQGQQPGVFGDRSSALGDFGIARFSDYKLGEQQDALQELVDSIAVFDNTLAESAIPERVEAMRKSIEGFTHSGPEDLFDTRLRAIIDGSGAYVESAIAAIVDPEQMANAFLAVLNLERVASTLNDQIQRDIIGHLEANAGDIQGTAGSLLQAIDATILLGNSVDRLNLQFDATAEGAIHSAFAIQDAVGGLENLAAIQQGYYQAAFSETERLSHAQEDLAASLMGVTENIPRTIEDLRALVEAQDLNTDAGANLAYGLMALAPALRETNAAVREAIDAQYQSVLGREAEADGLEYWFNKVASGASTLEDALAAIANSTEAAAYTAANAALAAGDAAAKAGAAAGDAGADTPYATQGVASENAAGVTRMRQDEYRAVVRERYYDNLNSYFQSIVSKNERVLSLVENAASSFESFSRVSLESAENAIRRMQGADINLDILESSIDALRSASADDFSSREEMLRFEGRSAALLDSIASEASKELSVAERQLSALESINQKIIDIEPRFLWSALLEENAPGLPGFTGFRIPGFANGGYHSGGLRIVGENGPELERTGPANIISNHKLRGMMGGSKDELEELKKMNKRLERIESYNKDSRKFQREISLQGDRIVHSETDA